MDRDRVNNLWPWAVVACLLAGCGTKRVVEYVPMETVRTERVEVTDTVVEVQLVPYRDSVTVADSTSRLENDYAVSHAAIKGGLLSHSLAVKEGAKVGKPFRLFTYTRTDTISYPVEVPVEVELSAWERTKLNYGGWAMGVVAVLLFFLLRRVKI